MIIAKMIIIIFYQYCVMQIMNLYPDYLWISRINLFIFIAVSHLNKQSTAFTFMLSCILANVQIPSSSETGPQSISTKQNIN